MASTELYESKEDEEICSYALGMQSRMIKDNQLSASSYYFFQITYSPSKARLKDKHAWMPKYNDQNQWIQIDLLQVKMVSGIATQGHGTWKKCWVKKYDLEYYNNMTGDLGFYSGDTFQGNTDHNNIVRNNLDPPIIAQIVRILPTEWNEPYRIAMRVELYGCHYSTQTDRCTKEPALGMENGLIRDTQLTASSSYTHTQEGNITNARLEDRTAWLTKNRKNEQWMQIDLLYVKKINGIATQGHPRYWTKSWVKKYRLQYRNDTIEAFHNYTVDGDSKPKTFQGNTDNNSIVFNALVPPIIAQIVRIVPTEWNNGYHIAMRVELYGCPYKGSYHND